MAIELRRVHVENLRGYWSSSLDLGRECTVLVGRNNAGKTSLLKIVDWLLNRVDYHLFTEGVEPDVHTLEFLLPSRSTKHRARRITLDIYISDGRSHRRYNCIDSIAHLRINLRQTPRWTIYASLGPPVRGEVANTNPRALELLQWLREESRFIYIPSFRDGNSPRFRQTLLDVFKDKLAERTQHEAQAGAPLEYRRVKGALDEIRSVSEELANPIWEEMKDHLPPGLAKGAQISLALDSRELVDWVSEHLMLRISTGDHDENTVRVTDLGSGLQSLLDFAIHHSEDVNGNDEDTTLVFEEPESFLHPSAQRTLARSLFGSAEAKKIITTHSPIIVEEAGHRGIVLCRNQGFFQSNAPEEREEINAALLIGYGAEMLFATSVLLVEGEGDRLFFERIRRRLAAVDSSGLVDEMYVVPVGGKAQFAPWIRLLESYVYRGERPIRWVVAADGDAVSEVREAFRHAGVSLPQDILSRMGYVNRQRAVGVDEWRRAIKHLNSQTRGQEVSACFMPVDLESAVVEGTSEEFRLDLADKIGCSDESQDSLLRFLGSKAVNSGNDPVKHPWIRGYIGENISGADLSQDVRNILIRWLEGVMPARKGRDLLREMD